MLTKLGVIAAIPFILVGAFFITTDTIIVDVRPEDGPRILVPVPMALARTAIQFAPEEEMTFDCPEVWQYRDAIRRVVDELAQAPDGELVRVEDGDTFVRIAKDGNILDVRVEDGAETDVAVRFPIKAAHRFLDRLDDETFTVKDLMASMNNTMTGKLVHVRDGDTEVKITVW